MRVQHNIAAMNSYRNYNNNTKTINKNLEKLSSGYKINRAGDDAAGLAISEKMRAQITGLDVAQKNAKDGISLVQTAEGALTEVHSMLNRMVELAEQSANGTYDSSLDRDQLQKEVNQLRMEINRIADSSNFNGLKLLDGSMSGTGGVSEGSDLALSVASVKGLAAGTVTPQVSQVDFATAISNGGVLATAAGTLDGSGDSTLKASVMLSDGTEFNYTFEINTSGAVKLNGETLSATVDVTGGEDGSGFSAALAEALTKESTLNDKYTFSDSSGVFSMTSTDGRFGDVSVKVVTMSLDANNSGTISTENMVGNVTTAGKGEHKTLNVANLVTYDAASATKSVNNSVFTVDGQKFAFVKNRLSAQELGADVNVIEISAGTAPAAANVADMVKLMNQKLNANIETPSSGTTITMITKGGYNEGGGVGLKLQIGDTSESFNQLSVNIKDMHAVAMGIGSIDISTQDGAAISMDKIKSAINYVSDVRGGLGATQNRLEHTINNLSVMQENIQDAESTIRDTDVADEMMKYTKNSILVQSAQAMLAQANQQPQGVLQLLQ